MPSIPDTDTSPWVIQTDDSGVSDQRAATDARIGGVAVVILARDEADVLSASIRSIRTELEPGDELHVVADGCSDGTATIARANGARVHVRAGHGASAKGQALAWWLSRSRTEAHRVERVIVLDADSRVLPGFLGAMKRGWTDERAAYQARIVPECPSSSPVARLAGFSELTEQDVKDRLSARLGLPVRLRGTGMGLERSILEALAPELRTPVEDAELSLLLTLRGVPIRPTQDARVLDPKPTEALAAARQRSRWLRGQVLLLREHPRELFRLAIFRPRSWPMLASIFLRPKSLWIPLRAGLTITAWITAVRHPWVAIPAALLTLWVAWDLACLALGLARDQDRAATLRALAASPLYLVIWATSAVMALTSGQAWLRARPLGDRSHTAREAGGGS